jgi:hypothetical protein
MDTRAFDAWIFVLEYPNVRNKTWKRRTGTNRLCRKAETYWVFGRDDCGFHRVCPCGGGVVAIVYSQPAITRPLHRGPVYANSQPPIIRPPYRGPIYAISFCSRFSAHPLAIMGRKRAPTKHTSVIENLIRCALCSGGFSRHSPYRDERRFKGFLKS